MTLISIVSGTYNRLSYLKSMVESARLSIGVGIEYEFIIVDGGSTDGTIEWLKSQKDIVSILQGKLVGAVQAFKAGFERAQGKYVIIGNDDITFVNESIQCAIAFMEDNKTVGIGCFYQDRYGKPWHVEYMSGVVGNKAVPVPYGQVCIVPKELGDKVGWWDPGVGYYTYAGDNELSCNMYELGYDIQPIPCACIHDLVAKDELRQLNNPTDTVDGMHPDSAKYVKKWKRNGLLGPIIPTEKLSRTDDTSYRILYAPIYERGHALQHITKRGLRDAFTERGFIVSEVDYIVNKWLIFDVANAIRPHIILTQFHDASIFNANLVAELKSEHPGAIFINWNGDYFPEHFLARDYMEMMKLYDMATFVTPDVDKAYDAAKIHWKYWQIGYEKSNATLAASTPRHDVIFLGNGHYNFRMKLGHVLRQMRGVDVGLYGAWPSQLRANGRNLYDYDAGQRLYMAAKIAISDGRPGTRFVSNRIFQAMCTGCFTLQQWFPEMEELLGYVDGVHYVTYKETDELPGLINYWLQHDDERNKIALTGMLYTLEHHSFANRVDEFVDMLHEIEAR